MFFYFGGDGWVLLYLDTNVYIGAKYIFDREKFNTLRNLISQDKVTVLYTKATEGEVIQHLEEDVAKGIKSYNHVIKKEIPLFKDASDYGIKEISLEEAVGCAKMKLNEFFSLDGVECISLNPLDAETLLDDYFHGVAPFENKKPYEFKDAIVINAIKNYQKSCGEIICVVSNDEGFCKAFEGDGDFLTFQYLSGFFGYYQSEQAELAAIEQCISNAVAADEFDNIIRQNLEDLDIERGDYAEWECIEKTIDEIECTLEYIDQEDGRIIAYIDADIRLSARIKYRDEDNSYYDKEEGRYLIENYVTALERHMLTMEFKVECFLGEDSAGERVLDDCTVIENSQFRTIDLDEDTLYGCEEISKDEREESDLEYCNQCGKLLGKSFSGIYFDYEENPLCEDCMVSDNKGAICPKCGRKVPFKFMDSGFCQDCSAEEE